MLKKKKYVSLVNVLAQNTKLDIHQTVFRDIEFGYTSDKLCSVHRRTKSNLKPILQFRDMSHVVLMWSNLCPNLAVLKCSKPTPVDDKPGQDGNVSPFTSSDRV